MKHSLRLIIPASSANLGAGFDCASLGLALYNEYQFRTHQPQTSFDYHSQKHNFRKNLVEQAYQETCRSLEVEAIPFHLKCTMNIPYSKGLGSSANAIIAGVALARFTHSLDMSRENILRNAQRLEHHIDNLAGCLYGGFNISLMTEKKPINVHHSVSNEMECALIFSSRQTETDVSRGQLPKFYSKEQVVFNISRAIFLAYAFAQEKFSLLKFGMEDCIHEPFRYPPEWNIEALKSELMQTLGFYALALSGSGPTIIILCRTMTKEITEKVHEHFEKCKETITLTSTKIDNKGLQIFP